MNKTEIKVLLDSGVDRTVVVQAMAAGTIAAAVLRADNVVEEADRFGDTADWAGIIKMLVPLDERKRASYKKHPTKRVRTRG